MMPQPTFRKLTNSTSKGGAVFLRRSKKTKLLEYKKKVPQDNEVITHQDGTFEFVSKSNNNNKPKKNDSLKKDDEKNIKKGEEEVTNVVFQAIKNSTTGMNLDKKDYEKNCKRFR